MITQDGEPIVHNLGTGRLRIDVPLPPRKIATAPPVAARPVVAAATPKPVETPARPLSRLEKLRLENKERTKAATEGSR